MPRRIVLFDSWHGRYSDSPRAISEALQQRYPELQVVWTLSDPSEAPDGVASVVPRSRQHAYYLLRADVLVANNSMPMYPKRPGARYLQTWHGTPLKRIAFDIENPHFISSTRYLRQFAKDVARWDALISPNPHSTEIFRRAFRYDGAILELGYPRNDVLAAPAARTADDVKRQLGIPKTRRVVLYAPTWRDAASEASERKLLGDLARWEAEMPRDDVLVLRGHQHDRALTAAATIPGRVINASQHPDIRDLYLIADVLVTDYSSTMFDFAVTGRPMVFFTYDLERYRDELRGFYVDFAAEAPGPLANDVHGLLEALTSPRLGELPSLPAYRRFVDKYCPHEDGRATERVIEALRAWW